MVQPFQGALMIAYAIGRIGCQVSGDGDWGVYNSAYTSDANGKEEKIRVKDFVIDDYFSYKNGKIVYAKVIGRVPTSSEKNTEIVLSPAAAKAVHALDARFLVNIKFIE